MLDSSLRKTVYTFPGYSTQSYTAHAATAMLQDAVRDDHRRALDYLISKHPLYGVDALHLVWAQSARFQVATKVPVVWVQCSPQGRLDTWWRNASAKLSPATQFDPTGAANTDSDIVDVLKQVQRHLFERGITKTMASPLDNGIFDGSRRSIVVPIETGRPLGLLVLLATAGESLLAPDSTPSNVLACSIDPRWRKARTVFTLNPGIQTAHESIEGKVANLVTTELDADDDPDEIKIHPSWFNRVAPVMSDELVAATSDPIMSPAQANQTTLEKLVDITYFSHLTNQGAFQIVISTVVADGLSRSGLIPNINGSRFLSWSYGERGVSSDEIAKKLVKKGDPEEAFGKPSILQNGNSTRMIMRATYTGYVMTASGWFEYFSIVILLVHAAIALAHTIWVVFFRKETSGAWDTILELISLAQMSQPPGSIMANASAGIRSWKTVKLVAWVETRRDGNSFAGQNDDQGRELQLRVDENLTGRDGRLKPVVGNSYGSNP